MHNAFGTSPYGAFAVRHEGKYRHEGRKADLRRSCEVQVHRMRKQTFSSKWYFQPQRMAATSPI